MLEKDEIWDQWITYFKKALESPNPTHAIRKFFLDVEAEAYNRALFYVIRSLDGYPDAGFIRGKIIAMRLSKTRLPDNLPGKADVVPFPPQRNDETKEGKQ